MNYNAYDIERYLKRQMNAAEMHAFEKAMMDDPFLSEAVDGYRPQFNERDVNADLDYLNEKIASKKKAVVIDGAFRKWLSIAAGFVIVLSLAVVLFRIFNKDEKNNDNRQIAKVTPKLQKDTVQVNIPETKVDSNLVAVNEVKPKDRPAPVFIASAKKPVVRTDDTVSKLTEVIAPSNDFATTDKEERVESSPSALSNSAAKQDNVVTSKVVLIKPEIKKQENNVKFNSFIGRVVDENNNPLPFANITERTSGIGTYADVNGYFNLISSDTVLSIETKSLGYTEIISQLKYNSNQKIVLKDEAVIADAPTTKDFADKYKERKAKMQTEVSETESEPADGWRNYNIYIANNIREPLLLNNAEQKPLAPKKVVISFDVLPDGNIANLKVENSNCNSCNTEAMRLLKDGPKWKSKTGKKERTSFTVEF